MNVYEPILSFDIIIFQSLFCDQFTKVYLFIYFYLFIWLFLYLLERERERELKREIPKLEESS